MKLHVLQYTMNTGSIPNDSFLNKKNARTFKIKNFKIKIWKSINSYNHIIKTNKKIKTFIKFYFVLHSYTTTKSYKSPNLEETKMPFEKPENRESSTGDLSQKKTLLGSLLFSLKFFQIFE